MLCAAVAPGFDPGPDAPYHARLMSAALRIVREPLVHFLALGVLVFALHAALAGDAGGTSPKQITVTAADVEQLKALWSKQWQRPPTAEELDRLIEDSIRERVLYREALALGLDRNDTILRRRLAQKMEFLITDLSVPARPRDEDLRAFHRERAELYVEPSRISFQHVYFNPDQRGERIELEAQAALETLQRLGADGVAPEAYGDRFMLPTLYDRTSVESIARDFGRDFAVALEQLSPGGWQGPIASGYGVHLVHVRAREAARQRAFEEVRQQVENDYLFERRREANDAVYRKLRESYEIVVQHADREPRG